MKVNLRLVTALACVVLAGASFAQQGQGQGRRGQGRMGRNGMMTLSAIVQRADVQTDLGLTDEQKTKLTELRPQRGQRGQRGQGGNGGGNGGNGGGVQGGGAGQGAARGAGGARNADPAAMAKRREEEKAKLAAILSTDQMKRAGEILIQLEGDLAVGEPDVAKELNFTADQQAKLKDLQAKFREASTALREKMQSGDMDRQEGMTAMQANQKTLLEQIHKILTPEQVTKLKDLGGKPFQKAEGNGR